MINLIEQIDFSKDISQEPELLSYYKQAAKQIQKEQYDQLLKFKKPVFDQNLENHLIVTNIPDIKGKQDKFIPFFKGFLDKKAIGVKDGLESLQPGFTEVNGEKKYNKTLYMIYKNASVAKKAYQKLHQLKFDKEHTLSCFTVKQFKDVQKLEKQYKQPVMPDKKQLISHNIDEKYRDQFLYVIKQGNTSKLVLKWFDHIQKKVEEAAPEEVSNTLKVTVNNVIFSTKGLYIAVCEPGGVRLLYGNNLSQKGFYRHEGVSDIAFSPNQSFMVTYNKSLGATTTQESYVLWAVEPEIKLQQYKAQPHQNLTSFQFNKDETKLAIVLTNQFVVYSCDTVDTLKKQLKMSQQQLEKEGKLSKAQNLQKLVWLPDGVSLTCVCYELNPTINTHPTSKIFTYNTQTREEKKWRAIGQHIKRAEITISENGDWIAVSFKKIQKKNLSISVIYIVNLLKREIETDVVQFKENVVSISWDRQNGRFGAVYEIPAAVKNDDIKFAVAFYQIQIKDKIQQAIKFAEIAETPANRIILSQNGAFFAMFNVSTYSWGKYKYTLGAFAKDPKTKKTTIEIIKQNVQISYMTFFEMDESGRFFIAGTDKSYQIWTISGQLVSKDSYNTQIKFVRFRPRYLVKLSSENEAKLEERQKDIKKKYEQEDEKRQNALEYEKKKEKEQKKNSFKKYLEGKKAWLSQFKEKRSALGGFNEEDPKVKSATYVFRYLQRN